MRWQLQVQWGKLTPPPKVQKKLTPSKEVQLLLPLLLLPLLLLVVVAVVALEKANFAAIAARRTKQKVQISAGIADHACENNIIIRMTHYKNNNFLFSFR